MSLVRVFTIQQGDSVAGSSVNLFSKPQQAAYWWKHYAIDEMHEIVLKSVLASRAPLAQLLTCC